VHPPGRNVLRDRDDAGQGERRHRHGPVSPEAERETDDLLHTVAEQAGYTSEYAFAKALQREFGTAPGQYRNGHRYSVPANSRKYA
jgi:AraC-like DNA-binding protein